MENNGLEVAKEIVGVVKDFGFIIIGFALSEYGRRRGKIKFYFREMDIKFLDWTLDELGGSQYTETINGNELKCEFILEIFNGKDIPYNYSDIKIRIKKGTQLEILKSIDDLATQRPYAGGITYDKLETIKVEGKSLIKHNVKIMLGRRTLEELNQTNMGFLKGANIYLSVFNLEKNKNENILIKENI